MGLVSLGQGSWVYLKASMAQHLMGDAVEADEPAVAKLTLGSPEVACDAHPSQVRDLKIGDPIQVELADGRKLAFAVTGRRIVSSRRWRFGADGDTARLTLVTGYPFDAINSTGPLRYVVSADPIVPQKSCLGSRSATFATPARAQTSSLSPPGAPPAFSKLDCLA